MVTSIPILLGTQFHVYLLHTLTLLDCTKFTLLVFLLCWLVMNWKFLHVENVFRNGFWEVCVLAVGLSGHSSLYLVSVIMAITHVGDSYYLFHGGRWGIAKVVSGSRRSWTFYIFQSPSYFFGLNMWKGFIYLVPNSIDPFLVHFFLSVSSEI